MKSEPRNMYVRNAIRNRQATAGRVARKAIVVVVAVVMRMVIVAGDSFVVMWSVAASMGVANFGNATAWQQ